MLGKNRPRVVKEGDGKIGGGSSFAKMFYQVLQLLHHIGVAKEQAGGNPSKAFERKTSHLDKFVRPARPDNSVRRDIRQANLAWATGMGKIMLNHYQTTLNRITDTLAGTYISKENVLSAKQTALQWGKRNFGNKLNTSTVTKFSNMIRNLGSGRHTNDLRKENNRIPQGNSSHTAPRHENTRGNKGSYYPAPRYTHNLTRPTLVPGSTKPIFRQNRDTPQFTNSEQYLRNITNNMDPASNDYLCEISLPNSFDNASFASGTHALPFAQAIYLDQDHLADAIFAAKTAEEVHRITRQFPTDLGGWYRHAENKLWEILIWKLNHVPEFSNRILNSGKTNFIDHCVHPYWGMGLNGKGGNQYGKAMSSFRDFQLTFGERANHKAPPPSIPEPPTPPMPKPTPARRKRIPTPRTSSPNRPIPVPIDNTSPAGPQGKDDTMPTPLVTPINPRNRFLELSMSPSPLPPTPKPRNIITRTPESNSTPTPPRISDNSATSATIAKPLYSTVAATPPKVQPLPTKKIGAPLKRNFVGRRPGHLCSHNRPSINRSHRDDCVKLVSRSNGLTIKHKSSPLPRKVGHGDSTTPPSGPTTVPITPPSGPPPSQRSTQRMTGTPVRTDSRHCPSPSPTIPDKGNNGQQVNQHPRLFAATLNGICSALFWRTDP